MCTIEIDMDVYHTETWMCTIETDMDVYHREETWMCTIEKRHGCVP